MSSPDAFEALANEHHQILRVADGLVRWASRESNHADDGRLELRAFVGYLRHFVVGCHFAKEEAVALGPARTIGPPLPSIEAMDRGHEACRHLFGRLHEFATMHSVWSRAERRAIIRAAEATAEQLRDVFKLEETLVYPQLRVALPPTVQLDLHDRLVEHERLHTGSGEHERHMAMGEALAR